jgi:hypothetical protein
MDITLPNAWTNHTCVGCVVGGRTYTASNNTTISGCATSVLVPKSNYYVYQSPSAICTVSGVPVFLTQILSFGCGAGVCYLGLSVQIGSVGSGACDQYHYLFKMPSSLADCLTTTWMLAFQTSSIGIGYCNFNSAAGSVSVVKH